MILYKNLTVKLKSEKENVFILQHSSAQFNAGMHE